MALLLPIISSVVIGGIRLNEMARERRMIERELMRSKKLSLLVRLVKLGE